MPHVSATPLPTFDQAQVDKRFLTELARLLEAEVFATYRAWDALVGVSPSYVAAIEAGRYHANLKLLYETGRHYPSFDLNYVIFGAAVYARPEPERAPKRARGPAPGRKRAAPPTT